MRRRQRKPCVRIHDLATHEPAYVELRALQAYWQVTYQTLIKWIHAETLPAYRLGRSWRVKTADALAFEAKGLYKVSA